jgi:hypothetical protein
MGRLVSSTTLERRKLISLPASAGNGSRYRGANDGTASSIGKYMRLSTTSQALANSAIAASGAQPVRRPIPGGPKRAQRRASVPTPNTALPEFDEHTWACIDLTGGSPPCAVLSRRTAPERPHEDHPARLEPLLAPIGQKAASGGAMEDQKGQAVTASPGPEAAAIRQSQDKPCSPSGPGQQHTPDPQRRLHPAASGSHHKTMPGLANASSTSPPHSASGIPSPEETQRRQCADIVKSPTKSQSDPGAYAPMVNAPDADRCLALVHHLAADREALDEELNHIADALRQNTELFERAIQGRTRKDRRDEIKAERARLVKQQESLNKLSTSLQAFRTLRAQRETVAKQTIDSYFEGHDTDGQERQLDKLTEAVQEAERQLVQTIVHSSLEASMSRWPGQQKPMPCPAVAPSTDPKM